MRFDKVLTWTGMAAIFIVLTALLLDSRGYKGAVVPWAQRWPSLSAQQTPIIKWNLGGLKCDVALSTGCARRVVELA